MFRRRQRRIQDGTSVSRTFIAPSTKIVGRISGKDGCICCGTIEGDCDIDGPLTLAESGRWKGTLRATHVVIAGIVDGDVVAADRVEIGERARVTGTLTGASIAVAEGAVVDGEINVTTGGAPKVFKERRGKK